MKLRVFECESCHKQTDTRKEGDNCFPYNDSWIYLYNFNFKLKPFCFAKVIDTGNIDKVQSYISIDSHFCSKNCLIKFLEAQLDENRFN